MALVRFGSLGDPHAVAAGTTLLAAAVRGGMPLGQSCRGQGVCNSCRVRVDEGDAALTPPTALELRWQLPDGWRLACQARICGESGAEDSVRLACPAWA